MSFLLLAWRLLALPLAQAEGLPFANPIFRSLSAKDRPELSREIQRAVQVQAVVKEFQLQSDLQGKLSGSLLVRLQVETFQSFHLYKDRLESIVHPSSLGEWDLKLISAPAPIRFLDPITHEVVDGYEGQNEFLFELRLRRPLSTPPREGDVVVLATGFQACDKHVCLLPAIQRSAVALTLSAPVKEMSALEKLSATLKEKIGRTGDFSAVTLLILFLAGLITAFTPCVYPLYPITLGIFGRWSQNSHIPPLVLVLVYCASMTLSYALLGLVSAASGTVFGSLTQTPGFLIATGLLILLSSLFFSGIVEIPIPVRLLNLIGRAEGNSTQKKNYLAHAAVMGLSLGIVGSPCVGPVLVSLLAWLGSALSHGGSGTYVRGFFLLSLFGLGMSTPFLVMGYFVIRLHRRPQLGKITPWVKHLGAVVMASSSLFFLIPGFHLLRAAQSSAVTEDYPVLSYEDYLALPQKGWTLLDFRADWCAACVQLERETFSQRPIADLFRSGEWKMVRIDLTLSSPEAQRYAQELGVVSLPSVLLASPTGKICRDSSLYEFEDAAKLLDRLRTVKTTCR